MEKVNYMYSNISYRFISPENQSNNIIHDTIKWNYHLNLIIEMKWVIIGEIPPTPYEA